MLLSKIFTGVKDGRTSEVLYNTHQLMIRRCYDETYESYQNYGAKGVTVCDKWINPVTGIWDFIKDMGERPEGKTLDRIDPHGNYCPENCRWVAQPIQVNNTRQISNNKHTTVKGLTWCERDSTWIVQITLNSKRTCIGRFSWEEYEKAVSVRKEAVSLKLLGVSDDEIYEKLVTNKRGILGEVVRRGKSSKYPGVTKKGEKWVAMYRHKYLGIFLSEDLAYEKVLMEKNKNGS